MQAEISQLGVRELLQLEAKIIVELRDRGLVRTNNKPLGDIAEQVVLNAYGGLLEPNSTKSHDITDQLDRKLQVKAMSRRQNGGAAVFSPFRSFDFDFAVFLVFAPDTFELVLARSVPAEEVEAASRYVRHTNGHQPTLRQIERLGDDVTAELRAAYESLDAMTMPFSSRSLRS